MCAEIATGRDGLFALPNVRWPGRVCAPPSDRRRRRPPVGAGAQSILTSPIGSQRATAVIKGGPDMGSASRLLHRPHTRQPVVSTASPRHLQDRPNPAVRGGRRHGWSDTEYSNAELRWSTCPRHFSAWAGTSWSRDSARHGRASRCTRQAARPATGALPSWAPGPHPLRQEADANDEIARQNDGDRRNDGSWRVIKTFRRNVQSRDQAEDRHRDQRQLPSP